MKQVQAYPRIVQIMALAILVAVIMFWILPQVTAQGPEPTPPPPQPGVPDGYTLIEGDILVRTDRLTGLSPSAVFATNLWTNGIVPYEFDANVSAWRQTAILTATVDWENVANVDFRPRAGDANYLHIRDSTLDPGGGTNSSQVGMQGGMQIVNIVSWGSEFIMVHELGHALGFWHEQSRSDRGPFVTINNANICKATDSQCLGGFCFNTAGQRIDCDYNFATHPEAGLYGPYDFDSLMHYDQCAFSRSPTCPVGGGETISVTTPYQGWQNLIGQRAHLSDLDRLTMSFLYPQPNWRFVNGAYTGSTENGQFLTPYKQFPAGFNATPSDGTLWVQPGTYSSVGTYSKAVTVTLRAPLGNVMLGP